MLLIHVHDGYEHIVVTILPTKMSESLVFYALVVAHCLPLTKQINSLMLDDLYNVSIAAFMYKVNHERIVSSKLASRLFKK
jgi:hypothetical protein